MLERPNNQPPGGALMDPTRGGAVESGVQPAVAWRTLGSHRCGRTWVPRHGGGWEGGPGSYSAGGLGLVQFCALASSSYIKNKQTKNPRQIENKILFGLGLSKKMSSCHSERGTLTVGASCGKLTTVLGHEFTNNPHPFDADIVPLGTLTKETTWW